MFVRNILVILGASTFCAAYLDPRAATPAGGVPTTLIPVPLLTTGSATATASLSRNSTASTGQPSVSRNSTASALKTITSKVPATRTVTLRPVKTRSYEACGGFRATPKPCPASFECIKNPFDGGCGPACDGPGICVVPIRCGGFAGIPCPDGKFCADDPRDDCNPMKGGADCMGICL
ncbi:hypothetical protein LX32DRAFT_639837 [Colletotrichum zoysiae]|uniref:Uncharacterized protein n=1 Tax=Colletotrichum zoysiae TaxID=1216348 RepID=A0AAD9M1M0_9PEZI|nr:hypothetical protein LX32DRAFT_639837 [Colletotrichum zoysiae]